MEDPERFRGFLRMDTTFYEIVEAVRPFASKKQTHLRQPVSVKNRVAITQRYLATGESFRSLEYTFRVSHSLISKFVPEVCDAIYSALKVCFINLNFLFRSLRLQLVFLSGQVHESSYN